MPGINTLGRYELVRELGRGAMGVVWLASDPVIGRTVALKTIELPEGVDRQGREEYHRRFLQEARAAGGLSHPGIVTIFDAGRDEETGRHFLAMEHVEGRTLKKALEEDGPLPPVEALRVLRRVAEGLAAAHGNGVVHRDLKPANILIARDGSVKIADFGVARVAGSDLTREGQSLGSPAYMSPEQVVGRPVDPRSDLFSLGVLLHEMLTGVRPFDGRDAVGVAYQVVHARPRRLREIDPGLAPGWQELVDRLLAKRPEERHQDVRSLLGDLHRFSVSPASRARPARPDRHLPGLPGIRPGAWDRMAAARMTPLALAVLAGLVVVSVVLGALRAGGGTPVTVDFVHGLEQGRLRILVDGSRVVDTRFTGKKGKGPFFGRKNRGSLEIPLQIAPGVREFRVEIAAGSGDRQWTKTLRREVPEQGAARLEVRVETRFLPGLRLDWEAEEVRG